MTTTSRPDGANYLPRTLCSLQAAGFETLLFPDQGGGIVKTWISAANFLRKQPQQRVVIFQDDVVCCRDLARYVSELRWPPGCGCVSLYKPSHYPKTDEPSLIPAPDPRNCWGACGLVFPAEVTREIVSHPALIPGVRYLDRLVGRVIAELGYDWLYVTPSLVQHIGEVSAIPGHAGGCHGRRSADDFIGEQAWPPKLKGTV